MPSRLASAIVYAITAMFAFGFTALCNGQEKSVKPGINDSFQNPDVKQFVGRFEIESREVFTKRKEIVAACGIQPGQTVADIGAGTGLFTALFSEAVGKEGRVIAVDIAKKFLEHIEANSRAAGRGNVETLLCTADSTELPPDSIDVAYICDTYHHFEFPLKTMASLHRALKANGRLLIVDFRRIPGKSTEWTLKHVRASQEVVESELVEAGFEKVRDIEGIVSENYLVEFKKAKAGGLRAMSFPIIPNYGGVVPVENGLEKPQAGAKVVLDVTADANPDAVNKGLLRAARLLNLYGAAGLKTDDVRISIVLHGGATKSILNHTFYAQRYGVEKNPNLELIDDLRKAGVEVLVCAQGLNSKGFADSAVAEGVTIAVSAVTAAVNRQLAGYVCLLIP